jgi:predicted DNA-binding protein (MmcQ/YjbR family)
VNVDWVRELCLSFPHATEQITWGCDLTFRVAGKIFAVTVLEPASVWLTFKCSPQNFAELTERAGIVPAPYLARAQWVALETKDALRLDDLAHLLRESYDLVVAKLPKKTRDALSQAPPTETQFRQAKAFRHKPSRQKAPAKECEKEVEVKSRS